MIDLSMFGNAARKIEPLSLEPGIYHDIPASDYHALPYLSSSFLKKFRDCPAAALAPFEPTVDMNVGSAIHAYSLEGLAAFNQEFAVMFESDLNKNTNEYKGLKRQFEQMARNKTILPAVFNKVPMMEVIKGVDNALRTHPLAGSLLKTGFQEVTLIWDDPETGVRCKARLDWNPGQRILADLKKTADVSRFTYQMRDLNYPIQAAHYSTGARECGIEVDTFIFVAVEACPPYMIRCGFLGPSKMDEAEKELSRLIGLVRDCKEQDRFPNYRIPDHIFSLNEITPAELLEEW